MSCDSPDSITVEIVKETYSFFLCRPKISLPVAEAEELATRAFQRAGVSFEAARDAAEILTLAEMMGIATHGLKRVATYTARIEAGGIRAGATPRVTPKIAGSREENIESIEGSVQELWA